MPQLYRNCFLLLFLFFCTKISIAQVDSVASTPAPTHDIFNAPFAKEYTIAGITVTGTKRYDQNLIISISGLSVGQVVRIPGTDAFSNAIIKLWRQNLVSDVQVNISRVEEDRLYVELQLTERPQLSDITFNGVKKSEIEDLEKKMGLERNRVLSESDKNFALEKLEKHYQEKGFRNVRIAMSEKPHATLPNTIVLHFDVEKGNKVKINNINFSNNKLIADNKLKKQMKGTKEMTRITLFPEQVISPYYDTSRLPTFNEYLKSMAFLTPTETKFYLEPYMRLKLFSSSKFNEKKYGEDKQKVLDYYNAQGYRDATILRDTTFTAQNGHMNIDIEMEEGRQYYFGDIVWKGNTKYSDSVLTYILGIKKGDPYNLETLNKRLGIQFNMEGGDITSLYQDDGYLYSNIDAIETAVYNDTIDYEIRIREGAQATYGKITVSGNDRTKDYVILREVRTIPGNKYSRQDIIRTQRELGALQFLNAEKIVPNVVPNQAEGTVDINWQVEEKSADQLELSAGFGGGIGLTGTLGVTLNNFSLKNILNSKGWDPLPMGDGQRLSARIQSNGRAYRSYNISFTEPWLGGKKRNSFSVNYYNTRFSNAFNWRTGRYDKALADSSFINTIGFGISLGKTLKWPDDYFNLIYSLNLQQYKLRNYANIFRGISTGNSTSISAKLTLLRNSAGPNPIFPSSGSTFLMSGQFTLPYSLLGMEIDPNNPYKLPEFHKWRFNGEWYIPIGIARGEDKNKQFIIKAVAKYGFIGRYNKELEISPFERFQLGDAGMSNQFSMLGYDIIAHRGYPIYSSSDPKVNPENVNTNEYFSIFNKYTVELRYPFSMASNSTIFGLAFFEAANGWYDFKKYNPFQLRRSAGVGMRFFLPMFGLLGFDYGIGFDRYNQTGGLKGAGKFTFMLGQEPE